MSTKIFVISFDMLRHYGEIRKQERSNAFCLFRLFTAKRRISVRDDTHQYLAHSGLLSRPP